MVERYRLIDYEDAKAAEERAEKEWPRVGDNIDPQLQGQGPAARIPVEDPGVFTMPWSATMTYLRAARAAWEERICAENVQHDYEARYYSDPDARLPTAAKPDF